MAGEKHLTYFEVENFKRFQHFEMDNIGQFNLIGGDNNVGKTTVLEALLLEEDDLGQTIHRLASALAFRNFSISNAGYKWILDLYQARKLTSGPQVFRIKKENKVFYAFILTYRPVNSLTSGEAQKLEVPLKLNQGVKEILELTSNLVTSFEFPISKASYSPFIPVNLGYDKDLVEFYSSQIQNSAAEETDLIQNLRSFIPDVVGLGISNSISPDGQNTIIVRLAKLDKPVPLPMFGEGAVKIFRILVEMAMCRGKRLMIDEIDTGIHFSRFKTFWKTILKAAKKYDVQLFATTHNHECLRFLKETLEDKDMQAFQADTRYFLLHEQADKSVKAINYSFPQFQFAIDQNNELRS